MQTASIPDRRRYQPNLLHTIPEHCCGGRSRHLAARPLRSPQKAVRRLARPWAPFGFDLPAWAALKARTVDPGPPSPLPPAREGLRSAGVGGWTCEQPSTPRRRTLDARAAVTLPTNGHGQALSPTRNAPWWSRPSSHRPARAIRPPRMSRRGLGGNRALTRRSRGFLASARWPWPTSRKQKHSRSNS